MSLLDKLFDFKGRETTPRSESIAGLTMFTAVVYILVLIPSLYEKTGMDFSAVYIVTAAVSAAFTLALGLFADFPAVVVPGVGLNAYIVYSVIISDGTPWQEAIGTSVIASTALAIMIVARLWRDRSFSVPFLKSTSRSFSVPFLKGTSRLVMCDEITRQSIVSKVSCALPESLKAAVVSGVGLFIALTGLERGRVIVASPMTVTMLGDFSDPFMYLTVFGLIVTMSLIAMRSCAAILTGMVATALLAWVQGFWELPRELFELPSGIGKTLWGFRLSGAEISVTVILTIVIVQFFDATLAAMSIERQVGVDERRFVRDASLLAVSLGSIVGGFFGTGPFSCATESLVGAASGGRTGFSSVVAASLLMLMIFFAPAAKAVAALGPITAPALVVTGAYMLGTCRLIEWDDMTEAFPAFLVIAMIPLTHSITIGASFGIVAHTVLKSAAGRGDEVSSLTYILAALIAIYAVI